MNKRPCSFGFVLFALLLLGMMSCTSMQNRTVDRSLPHSVRDACDAAYAIAASTPGVSIKGSTGIYDDEVFEQPVLGCQQAISGSFAKAQDSANAVERLRRSFGDIGWESLPRYDADGKDGTRFAFHNKSVICVFRGEWDGGSDGESETHKKEDWYRVFVLCTSSVPREDNSIDANLR